MNLTPIGIRALGQRASMEIGHPSFMAVVSPTEADAAAKIATRLGQSAVRVEAPPDARGLSARLVETSADPVIVSGLARLTDDAWRQLDRQRDVLARNRLTLLILSPSSAEQLARVAPNLASVFSSFFRLEEVAPAPPDPAADAADQAEFDRLARTWLDKTRSLSSMTRMIRHPAYEAIIAMGERAIRPILRDLDRAPQLWGPALHAITGALPVLPSSAGMVARVAQAWLAWARENGYAW